MKKGFGRRFLLITSFLSVCFYTFWQSGDIPFVAKHCVKLWKNKEIIIEGNTLVPDSEIRASLPQTKSNLWWLFNRQHIAADLSSDPKIVSARVSRCKYWSFNCFRVECVERSPKYLVRDGETLWLAGVDGGFISKLPSNASIYENLTIIDGIFREEASSADMVSARMNLARNLDSVLEENLGRPARILYFRGNGEFDVMFRDSEFTVTFSGGTASRGTLMDETSRLKRLLAHYRGRENEIKSVDLAFNTIAVVRLTN